MALGKDTKKLWTSPNKIYEIWDTQVIPHGYGYRPGTRPVAIIHYMDDYRGGYAEITEDGKISSGNFDSYTFQILPKYVKEKCMVILRQLYKKRM